MRALGSASQVMVRAKARVRLRVIRVRVTVRVTRGSEGPEGRASGSETGRIRSWREA